MTKRILPTGLEDSLVNNDEFMYLHLIKFEKPRNSSVAGLISGKASDYAYITDGYINVQWDDGSVDSYGQANGPQTYIANKVLSIGTVNETVEARASNMDVVLSGVALGTMVALDISVSGNTITSSDDFREYFEEGDKLLLERDGGANNDKYVRIDMFTNGGKSIQVTPVDSTLVDQSAQEYSISLVSEELSALVTAKGSTLYSSYINREVFIYRAHLNPENGEFYGAPILIFRGIISKGSVKDDVTNSSRVTWNLTSHWGDFVRIQGRLTSDSFHRALDIFGNPDVRSLIRESYAGDLGFMHAERAINIAAVYQSKEIRYEMKKRGGLAGLFGGKKLIEKEVMVDRSVNLEFNLSSKYLPVVYGVQRIDSLPIFADSLYNDPNTVYVAYAICEGEIGGVYDIYIDEDSSVCIDQRDADNRDRLQVPTDQWDSISVVCNGRADSGDVLAAANRYSEEVYDDYDGDFSDLDSFYLDYRSVAIPGQLNNLNNNNNTSGGMGLQHEDPFFFGSPIDAEFIIHTGKEFQKANQVLAKLGLEQAFKIQRDYFDGDLGNYWTQSHTLLDTAYAVGKFTISEGEVTIPKYEFVVRGKILDCYNYDDSYLGVGGDQSKFSLGDTVTLHRSDTDVQIGAPVQIIDKWYFYLDDKTKNYRFRYDTAPVLGTVTAFYMKNSAGDRWYMQTWNHKEISNAEGSSLEPIIVTDTQDTFENYLSMYVSSPNAETKQFLTTTAMARWVKISVPGVIDYPVNFQVNRYISNLPERIEVACSKADKEFLINLIAQNSGNVEVTVVNGFKLSSTASTTDDFYLGDYIELTQFDANDVPTVQKRQITKYIGSSRLIAVSEPWDFTGRPDSGDFYSILGKGDKRVTINPAIQFLDYISSKRYGKGLQIDKDIALQTFLNSAKLCDTRSDVTVIMPASATLSVGDIYKYESASRFIFQGKVFSIDNVSFEGTNYKQVTFTDVIGKLGYKWTSWRTFTQGDLFWHLGKAFIASSTGKILSGPTAGNITSLSLTKVSGAGASTVPLFLGDGSVRYSSSGNPFVKRFTNLAEGFTSSGYTLYDSDDVKYWIYVGWDEPEQRFVTRHQLNQVINTSTPVFDNINSMLEQFNGIMRYANGRYELDIKTKAPDTFLPHEIYSEDDIFGELSVDDGGQKDSYNSISASIVDPANKYSSRSISFFNSDYLKEDKGIPRQGSYSMPGVTNYYNARIKIQQVLDESRYGLTITFTTTPRAYLLLTGGIIQLSYSRFGWENKLFRVESLNFLADGLVQVTANEHNDDAYIVRYSRPSVIDVDPGGPSTATLARPAAPTALTASTGGIGGIELNWTNASSFSSITHGTEVYASDSDNFASSTLIFTTRDPVETYVNVLTGSAVVTKYYWVRHFIVTPDGRISYSTSYPLVNGVLGSGRGAVDGEDGEQGPPGADGEDGLPGADGAPGATGAGFYSASVTGNVPTLQASITSVFQTVSPLGRLPVESDIITITGTTGDPLTVAYKYVSGTWTSVTNLFSGDLVVEDTIAGDKLRAGSLISGPIFATNNPGYNVTIGNADVPIWYGAGFWDGTGTAPLSSFSLSGTGFPTLKVSGTGSSNVIIGGTSGTLISATSSDGNIVLKVDANGDGGSIAGEFLVDNSVTFEKLDPAVVLAIQNSIGTPPPSSGGSIGTSSAMPSGNLGGGVSTVTKSTGSLTLSTSTSATTTFGYGGYYNFFFSEVPGLASNPYYEVRIYGAGGVLVHGPVTRTGSVFWSQEDTIPTSYFTEISLPSLNINQLISSNVPADAADFVVEVKLYNWLTEWGTPGSFNFGVNQTAVGGSPSVTVDLASSPNGTNVVVTNTAGTDATIAAATTSLAGVMTAADKTKLDGIAAGAQVNVATNLTYSTASTTGTVNSSTGTNATIPAATTSLAGLMTGADKTKLNGIATGATANTGTVTSVALSAGTGISVSGSPITSSGTITVTNSAPNVTTNISTTHAASSVTVNSSDGTNGTINAATTSLAGVMTSADKTKLNGIATGATANTGTVTSVSGTGSYGGLSLSGTVTTSGSITLGGTPSGTWPISVSGNAASVGGLLASQFARNDIYNSVNSGFQVFRNIGSIDGSWQDTLHTLSLENSDSGTIVLNFHRGGYTSHNLNYNGTRFYLDAYTEAAGSLRAPIFYDSNNTGYYIDPASTSYINTLTAVGNITAVDFIATSDARTKSERQAIDKPLERLAHLNGETFVRSGESRRSAGYIAQDLEKALPEGVYENADGVKQVSNSATIGLLIESVKELQKQVEELKKRLGE